MRVLNAVLHGANCAGYRFPMYLSRDREVRPDGLREALNQESA